MDTYAKTIYGGDEMNDPIDREALIDKINKFKGWGAASASPSENYV